MRPALFRVSTLFLGVIMGTVILQADLDRIRAEKSLTKRARLAMEHADGRLDAARDSYLIGEIAAVEAELSEVEESVAFTYESLRETGRNPRKISKHYKRAEIGSRKLLRRLETFRNEMSYLDRDQIEEVMKAVQKVHDNLLLDVMGRER